MADAPTKAEIGEALWRAAGGSATIPIGGGADAVAAAAAQLRGRPHSQETEEQATERARVHALEAASAARSSALEAAGTALAEGRDADARSAAAEAKRLGDVVAKLGGEAT